MTDSEFLSAYANQQLTKREDEFVDKVPFSFFFGTWNVNGKFNSPDVSPWLFLDEKVHDIYVIGFQELDLSTGALLLGDETRSAPWEQLLLSCLSRKGLYSVLASKQLVGMWIVVFVRDEVKAHISDLYTDVEPVGIMGIMGNKGGVAVRFRLMDSSVCLVNCHLNAHHANVRRRNQDFRDISARLRFSTTPESGLLDHDHVFWIGDLNYRIDLPDAQVRDMVVDKKWDELMAADQLKKQQEDGLAFVGYEEGTVGFAPTYKYDVDTERYDTSEKRRAPAWCDRILYLRSEQARGDCQQVWYDRAELMSSDHRPVGAVYTVQAKRINVDKRQAVLHNIVEQLSKFENEARPDCTLSTSQWQLDPVRFGVTQTRVVTLRNNGPGPAKFTFVARPGATTPVPDWIVVSPSKAFVAPNTDCEIRLSVKVEGETASRLNMTASEAERKLDDILVLHLEHGMDFFVSVSGHYQASSFGCTLDHLVRRPTPLRVATPVSNDKDRLLVPKELWLLIDRLQRDGLYDRTLFHTSGDSGQVQLIREWLDTREDFAAVSADVSVHSVAEALLRFLNALAEPVVPFEHYAEALDAASSAERCRALLQFIPPVHYRTFHYVAALLRARVRYIRSVDDDTAGRREAARMAALFAPVMIRSTSRSRPDAVAVRQGAMFVAHFIVWDGFNVEDLVLDGEDEE